MVLMKFILSPTSPEAGPPENFVNTKLESYGLKSVKESI